MGYRIPAPQLSLSERLKNRNLLQQQFTGDQDTGTLTDTSPYLEALSDTDVYSDPEYRAGQTSINAIPPAPWETPVTTPTKTAKPGAKVTPKKPIKKDNTPVKEKIQPPIQANKYGLKPDTKTEPYSPDQSMQPQYSLGSFKGSSDQPQPTAGIAPAQPTIPTVPAATASGSINADVKPGDTSIVDLNSASSRVVNQNEYNKITREMDPETKNTFDRQQKLLKEQEDRRKESGELTPETSTPAKEQLTRAKMAQEYGNKLTDVLNNYTKQMSRNEEIAFWQKIVGGLGKIAAGATGLATETPVGQYYKEPETQTAEEISKTTQPQFIAQEKALGEQYSRQVGVLDAKSMADKELDEEIKANQQLLSPMLRTLASKIEQKQKASDTETRGVQQKDVTKSYPRPEKDKSTATDNVKYKIQDYTAATANALAELGNAETWLTQIPDNQQFANNLAQNLQTWGKAPGGKIAGIATTPAGVMQRFNLLKANGGFKNDAEIKKYMIDEVKGMMNWDFPGHANTEEGALVAMRNYGLPVKNVLIQPTKGQAYSYGNHLDEYLGKQRQQATTRRGAAEVKAGPAIQAQMSATPAPMVKKTFKIVSGGKGKPDKIEIYRDGKLSATDIVDSNGVNINKLQKAGYIKE